jgi:PTH1 family peptidyl-tRNA hydrolase
VSVVKVLVGLGNPGSEYRETRHNVGFLVIEELRRRHGSPGEIRRARCAVSQASRRHSGVLLARPQTYMNRSGLAVRALLEAEGAAVEELLVVCDDLNLEFGTLRIRPRGTHGGHNGLRSIIECLGTTEFSRLRVGIGPPPAGADHAEFVLERFPAADRRLLPELIEDAADCLLLAVDDGLQQAMNRYNRRPDAGHNAEG